MHQACRIRIHANEPATAWADTPRLISCIIPLQQCRVLLYAFCMCRNLSCRWTPPLHRVSLERKVLLPCVKSLFSQAYTRKQFNEICRELCDGYPTLKDVKKTLYRAIGYILNNSLQNFHNCFAFSSSPPPSHTQYITGYSQRSAHTSLL